MNIAIYDDKPFHKHKFIFHNNSSFINKSLYPGIFNRWTSSTHQWVRVTPGQIIMVKQVNIYNHNYVPH